MRLLEQLTDIYYKYFTTTYITGYEYRMSEIQERIKQDRNGNEY